MGQIVQYHDPEWCKDYHYRCHCDHYHQLNLHHFLNQCPTYNQVRSEWKETIKELEPKYCEHNNINNLQYLLFPHLLYPKNQQRTLENRQKRFKILQYLITFCKCRFDS